MRIAVNGWFAHQLNTGSGQYLSALLSHLPRAGSAHSYFLILPTTFPRSQSPISHLQSPVPGEPWHSFAIPTPFDRRSPNLAKLWFEQVSFPLACRRLHADVAFVPYWGSPWWRPCPVAVTVHDIIPLLLPLYRGGLLQRSYTALVSGTARRAHAILADSEAGRRDILSHLHGVHPDRVHAIHLAVDPAYRPVSDPGELARVRSRYNLPDGPFLLYLGGFDARKNVPRLLEAYAALRRRQPVSVSPAGPPGLVPPLVIAGRLPESDTAFAPDPRPIAARLGLGDSVHFAGWVAEGDKPALYSLAAAALFVSEYEGFGLPVLEAQACGCPVITAAASALDYPDSGPIPHFRV